MHRGPSRVGIAIVAAVATALPAAASAAPLTFAPPSTFTTGAGADLIATGNFNGDAVDDIAVPSTDAANHTSALTVYADDGHGRFTVAGTTPIASAPRGIAAGGLTTDGLQDIVTTNGDGSVSVLDNTTAPGASTVTFTPGPTLTAQSMPLGVAIFDLNGDGKEDIVVTNFGSGTVSVFVNTTPTGASTPTFAPAQNFNVGDGPDAIAIGDFNRDGKLDLAVANRLDGTVSVLLNTTPMGASTVSFAPQQTFAVGSNPSAIAAGPLTGSFQQDIVTANDDSPTDVSVLANTTPAGAATLSFAPMQSFTVGGGAPTSVDLDYMTVAPTTYTGTEDIVVGNQAGDVNVLLNTSPSGASAPTFAPVQDFTTFPAGTTPPVAPGPAVIDEFDGSGRPDVVQVAGGAGGGLVAVMLNRTLWPVSLLVERWSQADFTSGPFIGASAPLSGGAPPVGGTITFSAYGPGDSTCSAAPVFTSAVPVSGTGLYDSPGFTPTKNGTYTWTATYSGDANNQPAVSECGDPVFWSPSPPRYQCHATTGGVSGTTLGDLRLGMTRAQAHRAYPDHTSQTLYIDVFCLLPSGTLRAGYASPRLLKTLPRSERRRVRGEVIWLSTSSTAYAIKGIRPGVRLTRARHALPHGDLLRADRAQWYMAPDGRVTAVLEVRDGTVLETGIAEKRLTRTRGAQRRFINSFR